MQIQVNNSAGCGISCMSMATSSDQFAFPCAWKRRELAQNLHNISDRFHRLSVIPLAVGFQISPREFLHSG
jgi:hypothetical protein